MATKRKTKKQTMAEGFDRWTSNGLGISDFKAPKKKEKKESLKKKTK